MVGAPASGGISKLITAPSIKDLIIFSFSFKHAVYKNLGHYETIDQIRAGRYARGHMTVT